MTIAELIIQLAKWDPTTLVAVWNPSQAENPDADGVRLVTGLIAERVSLSDQADPTSDNFPIWEPDLHRGREMARVIVLS